MRTRHHVLLGVCVLGNAIVFAGVDPLTRMATVVLVLELIVDLRTAPSAPPHDRWAAGLLAGLVAVQLAPLPAAVRELLQPGFGRQRSVVLDLSAGVACTVGCGALIRSESRDGMLFLAPATIVTLPLWRRPR